MWVWLIMLASIVVIRMLIPDGLGEKKKNLIFLIVAFCIVVFFSGSRCPYLTGSVDLYSYFYCYKNSMVLSLDQLKEMYRFEDGYLLLNKILSWFVPWDYFIIYFESAFCTAVVFWYFYRNSKNVVVSVILYICVGPWSFFLTGFRQGFSICICLIAFELMKKRSTGYDLTALALILLAYSFHTSALVYLSVFFIRNMKINRKSVFTAILITLLALFFAKDILEMLNGVLEMDYVGAYIGNALGGIVPIAIYTLALVFCYIIWKEDNNSIKEMSFDIAMLLVGLCIYITRYKVGIFERISFYFTPVASVVLANAISVQKNKVQRNIMVVLCVFLSIVLYIYRMVLQSNTYHFFWEYWENLITI